MNTNFNSCPNKQWFTSTELATFRLKSIPSAKDKLIAKALREGWKRRPRTGKRGGGYEYHIDSLPAEARFDLLTKIGVNYDLEKELKEIKKELKPSKNNNNLIAKTEKNNLTKTENTETEKELPKVNERYHKYVSKALSNNKKEAEVYKKYIKVSKVKELILNKIKILQANTDFKSASLSYIKHYNAGFETQLIDDESLYTYVKSLSFSSVKRWKQAKEKDFSNLLPKEYKRASLIEKNEQIKNFMVQNLINNPYTPSKLSHQILVKKFGNICSYSAYKCWVREYKKHNQEFLTYAKNPDGWKSKYKASFGKAGADIKRLNQEWQMDSTVADIMLSDNKRYTIVGLIDVFSRRAILHVAESSSSEAVATCIVKGLIKFGRPEVIRTDNGKDYTSFRITEGLKALDIEQKVCNPFMPEEKPFIERFFGTFSHNLLTALKGYIGNSVAIRKEIESKKSFADRFLKKPQQLLELKLTKIELQNFCDAWVDSEFYGLKPHTGLKGKTPLEVAKEHETSAKHTIIEYEKQEIAKLLIMLGERKIRVVGKEGIKVDCGLYVNHNLGAFIGKQVITIFDAVEWGRIYVFNETHEFICTAYDVLREGFSRREVAVATKRIQKDNLRLIKEGIKALNKESKDNSLLIENMISSKKQETEDKEAEKEITAYLESQNQLIAEDLEASKEQAEKEKAWWNEYLELEEKLAKGEEILPEDREWLENYKNSKEYASKQYMREHFKSNQISEEEGIEKWKKQ